MRRLARATLISVAVLFSGSLLAQSAGASKGAGSCPALLNKTFPRLQDDTPQNLCQYAGKVLLVVNTASFCGFTSQYKGLEGLNAQYKDRGLVVLGFPSNDFSQEKGSNKDIAAFCESTFGVKFPMFSKTVVTGPQRHAFFNTLAKTTGKTPQWNFHKYLISADGKNIESFVSLRKPMGGQIENAIQRELAGMRSPQATK